ncbi:hypothetical protein ACH0CA_01520 [Kytococcus sedentarius]
MPISDTHLTPEQLADLTGAVDPEVIDAEQDAHDHTDAQDTEED